MSFDLGEEKFREIPSPGNSFEGVWGIFDGFLTFRNCLCVYAGSMFRTRFSIFMMKQYGVKESLTQVVKLTSDIVPKLYNPKVYLTPLWILENGEILVDKVKKGLHLALYDPKENKLKNVIDHDESYGFASVIYRETLVSPAIGTNIIPSVSHT
ncbi:hypothetical protein M0R45_032653 [Rubus argutus]|uniref:Uncharacterized protein n=1 Tax=Rubus argutus TaxID=59490 RepID=A0AAW1WJC1_RUBAR